jgi:hypothetical protein
MFDSQAFALFPSLDLAPPCSSGTTTGIINGNSILEYQKGGIVADCAGTNVTIPNNVVTGEGPVNYIAQNGIQLGYAGISDVGHKDLIVYNKVSGFGYTPQTPNCSGTHPTFLRFVHLDPSARGVPSNK